MINRAHELASLHSTDSEVMRFTQLLSNFIFIDVGTISSLHSDGFVDVVTSRVIGTHVVTYTNVELLAPGSSVGTYSTTPTNGTLCLLFCPRSVVPDTRTMALAKGKPIYSIVGMKALMVAHPKVENVQAGFSSVGNFVIEGPDYGASLVVTPEGNLMIQGENYLMTVTRNGKRTTQWRYRTQTILNDGSETETWYNSDYYKVRERTGGVNGAFITTLFDGSEGEVVLKTIQEDPDGTVTTTFFNGGDTLRTIVESADGSVNLEIGTDPNVTITLDADNGISITTTQDITLQCNGNLSAEVGGNAEITATGNVDITADGNATISSPNASITGGVLTVNGTATPTGDGPFCGVPACLFTGAPHIGSMVSGT